MEAVHKKTKRRMWTDETELAIIKLWQENIKELKKNRNSHAYLEIAKALGGRYTPKEVHSKISNFTQKYRNEKKRISTYGGSPTWKYYDKVGRILDRECESNFIKQIEELCEGDQCSFLDFPALPSTSTSSPAVSSPPLQVVDSPPPVKTSTSPPPAPLRLALSPSPVPESISEFSASRRSKRKLVNSLTLQKDVLKISKENQTILREQSAFSRNMAKEQFDLAKRSLKLLEENTQNSKYFATKIVEISEQQLKLEKDFMKIMKKVVKKIDLNT